MYFLQDTIENMYLSVYLSMCVRVHWCVCVRVVSVGVNSIKKMHFLSQFQSQHPYSLYITNDLSEDDNYSETAGDYALNTLLVLCQFGHGSLSLF